MPDQPKGCERERVLDIARGIALILFAFAFYHQAVDDWGSRFGGRAFDHSLHRWIWSSTFGCVAVVAGASIRLGNSHVRTVLCRAALFAVVAWWCRTWPLHLPLDTMFPALAMWTIAGFALHRMSVLGLGIVGVVSLAGPCLVHLTLQDHDLRWYGLWASRERDALFDHLMLPFFPQLAMPIAGMLACHWLAKGARASGVVFVCSAVLIATGVASFSSDRVREFWITQPLWVLWQSACGLALLSATDWLAADSWQTPLGGALAATGRLALTWSLFHVAVMLLLQQFPAWPIDAPMMRAVAGAAALIPFTVSPWLLSRWQQGPAEALLHWLARRHQPLFNVR